VREVSKHREAQYIKQSENHSPGAFHLPLDDNASPISIVTALLLQCSASKTTPGYFPTLQVPHMAILSDSLRGWNSLQTSASPLQGTPRNSW
jgi:hypothetical protein